MLFLNVEMFSTQKSAMPLSFSDFDFFADLQDRFGRFANLALCMMAQFHRFATIIPQPHPPPPKKKARKKKERETTTGSALIETATSQQMFTTFSKNNEYK